MRSVRFVMAVVFVAAVSGSAAAQTPAPSHWLASISAGSNFGTSFENVSDDNVDNGNASFNLGTQLGYLWGGAFGAELLADFSPSMEITNLAFNDSPSVNSYMFNAIGVVPIGAERNFQPYLSAGVGSIQLAGDVFEELQAVDTVHESHSTFGTNIGGGIMAFGNHVGFRTDLRYYRASSDDTLTGTNILAQEVLSGLTYWRANFGLGFRW